MTKLKSEFAMRRFMLPAALSVLTFTASCVQDAEPRQSPADRALADPWNYGPKPVAPDKSNEDDSGGRTSELDRHSFQRDFDHVFNP